MTLKKSGSNWVTEDRFFDRSLELELLHERIEGRIHTLIAAQRRMGKTSLLRELLRQLEDAGEYETVFVDLEAAGGARDAIAEIAVQAKSVKSAWQTISAQLLNRARGFGKLVEEIGVSELRIKLRAEIDEGNWQESGDRIFESLAQSSKPVVLAIDELPVLINRMAVGHDYRVVPDRIASVDLFLSWLRRNAQAHRDGVILLLAGSIGFAPVLSRLGLNALANVYSPYQLSAWDEDTGSDCLAALAATYGIEIPPDVREGMCRRLRCCDPHHVQQYFGRLHDHLRREGRSQATDSDAEIVYRQDMLGVLGQPALEHYQSRLRTVLGDDGYRVAFGILTSVVAVGGQVSESTIDQTGRQFIREVGNETVNLNDILHVLLHDGYLERRSGAYRFESGLLEDWWRIRYGQLPRSTDSAHGR
jgi:hypothetical protein